MKTTKIYIIGAGAIGKALAVFLQYEKRDVILIRGSVDNVPDEENEITVADQDKTVFKQKIKTTTLSKLAEINGVVVIASKAFANASLADKLKKQKGEFSIVLLQNGLDVERAFDSFTKVFRCVVLATSQVIGDNYISFKMVDVSPIGVVHGTNIELEGIVDSLNTPYWGFKAVSDITTPVWEKVIVNCAFNSICPLLEVDNGIFYRNEKAAALARVVIDEGVAIAREYGIGLKPRQIEEKLMLISERSDGQLISTYEDIRNGRKTEIESLNLAISRLADTLDKPELVSKTRLLGELIQVKSAMKMA